MAAKNGRKTTFGKQLQMTLVYTPWVNNFEIALSHTVSEIYTLMQFMQNFNIAIKNGGKTIFGKKRCR